MAAVKPLTVRVSPALHRRLQLTASGLGVSMNRFVERAVEKELRTRGVELEESLERVLEALRTYGADDVERDIEAFAASEVREEDPLVARRVAAKAGRSRSDK